MDTSEGTWDVTDAYGREPVEKQTKIPDKVLIRMAGSDLLERDPITDEPIYKHSVNCPNFCEYCCSRNGFEIAGDIATLEQLNGGRW